MPEGRAERLTAFERALARVSTSAELLRLTRDEVRAAAGYNTVWLMVGDKEPPDELRLIEFEGIGGDNVRALAGVLMVRGDAFLEAIIASDGPVVVADARIDPRTNKFIVEKLKNRTLVDIPLRLVDKPFGILGTGTFGDEGCRAPTDDELDQLVEIAHRVAIEAARVMRQESSTT